MRPCWRGPTTATAGATGAWGREHLQRHDAVARAAAPTASRRASSCTRTQRVVVDACVHLTVVSQRACGALSRVTPVSCMRVCRVRCACMHMHGVCAPPGHPRRRNPHGHARMHVLEYARSFACRISIREVRHQGPLCAIDPASCEEPCHFPGAGYRCEAGHARSKECDDALLRQPERKE